MVELFANEYYRVTLEPGGICRLKRSPVPYPDQATLHEAMQHLARIGESRPADRVLLDLREGPGRNDPAFEEATAANWQRLNDNFERGAVLVSTAAGRLQLMRLASERSSHLQLFSEEDEALRFLSESG